MHSIGNFTFSLKVMFQVDFQNEIFTFPRVGCRHFEGKGTSNWARAGQNSDFYISVMLQTVKRGETASFFDFY